MRAAAFTGALGVVGLATQVQVPAAHAAEISEAPTVNWDPIIACESGGNPTVVNASGHAGLLQFSTSTWLRYGGGQYAPTADKATPAQQLAVAERAFAANGLNDWAASQHCWGGKVDVSGTSKLAVTPPKATPRTPASPSTAKHDSGVTKAATGTPKHAAPEVTAAIEPITTDSYDVKPGDTLWMIAKRHGGETWQDVYAKNTQVVGSNPDLILPGQHLAL
jgi:LysM repeat protein